jgi:hypothetical protein
MRCAISDELCVFRPITASPGGVQVEPALYTVYLRVLLGSPAPIDVHSRRLPIPPKERCVS